MPAERKLLIRELTGEIHKAAAAIGRPVNLMEVCGTHTMAIARSGLKRLLPDSVHLLSGPGCPVCVTPPQVIDTVLSLSERSDVTIATYGDMIRVPGSRRGESLAARRAAGARVEIVYSPMDALDLAAADPEREVVFLGVGFETSAPGTAAAIRAAKELGLKNFSVFPMLKTVEPALRALLAAPDFNVQGFLLPGHVATIIGTAGFRYLAEEYHTPGVVSGFEPEDILLSVYRLLCQARDGRAEIENEYTRAVAENGNPLALGMMAEVLAARDEPWRGLGVIPGSGLTIRQPFEKYDAQKKFRLHYADAEPPTACRCGMVMQGKLEPGACPLFGTACLPEDPVGPCMVSSEGACAAAYKYQGV